MTGVPEEMKTEVEGEAWMMGHVGVRTPNPGSHSADLVCLPHHSTVKNLYIGAQQMYCDLTRNIRCMYSTLLTLWKLSINTVTNVTREILVLFIHFIV